MKQAFKAGMLDYDSLKLQNCYFLTRTFPHGKDDMKDTAFSYHVLYTQMNLKNSARFILPLLFRGIYEKMKFIARASGEEEKVADWNAFLMISVHCYAHGKIEMSLKYEFNARKNQFISNAFVFPSEGSWRLFYIQISL